MPNRGSTQISDRTKGLIVLTGVTIFLLLTLEMVLRLVGYADPRTREDPFMGFEGTPRAFHAEDVPGEGMLYVPGGTNTDLTQSFPVTKSEETFRIFTFGGSTTYGTPFGPEVSYPAWLQKQLSRLYPAKNIEVVNTGTRGYGSSRVLQLYREVIRNYEPDLLIVWNGHNEFRDATFHPYEIRRGPIRTTLLELLFGTRLFHLVHDGYQSLMSMARGPRQISYGGRHVANILSAPFSPETFSSHDYFSVPDLAVAPAPEPQTVQPPAHRRFLRWGKNLVKATFELGTLTLPPDEVYAVFGRNSAEMIELARDAGVDVIFLSFARNPKVRNALANPSFRVPASSAWNDEGKERWNAAYGSAVQLLAGGSYQEALEQFDSVSSMEGENTDDLLHLYRALCYEGLGMYREATVELERRFPALYHELNGALVDVTSEHGAPLIGVQAALKEASETGVVGYENYFVDEVHLTIEGYRQVATAVADHIQRNGYIESSPAFASTTTSSEEPDPAEVAFENAEMYTAYGWAAFANGDLQRALASGQKALTLDPLEIQAHLLLGYVHSRLERFEEAREEYEELARLYERQ